MRQHHTQPQKADLRRFHNEFKNFSVDTNLLYKMSAVDPAIMESSDKSISLIKHYEMMELAAEISHNPYLGIEMGLACQSNDLGMLGYMLRNAPTFEKAIEILNDYITLLAPETQISLLEEEDNYILTYHILNAPASKTRQVIDMTLAQFILIGRDAFDDNNWNPERIYFEYSLPEEINLDNFPMQSELVFGHYFNGVCFPKIIGNFKNDDCDPQLLALLEAQALQALESLQSHTTPKPLLKQIQFLISSRIGNIEITAEDISSELGMSRRTMHRRLSENGVTFNEIRENIVLNVAKETLSKTTVSITDLAHKLGYADSSAFDRAFKRLTKMKPLEYRKKHNSK